jgi:hypothetical protein
MKEEVTDLKLKKKLKYPKSIEDLEHDELEDQQKALIEQQNGKSGCGHSQLILKHFTTCMPSMVLKHLCFCPVQKMFFQG